MSDQLDRAVARTLAEPPKERRTSVTLNLGNDREATIDVPTDLTALEAMRLVGFVANGLAQELAKSAAQPVIEPVRGGLHAIPRPT